MAVLVDEVHGKFLAATQKLWDDYKDKFAPDRRREMRFVAK
jgi:predicted PolB exonuclease-like 3'-5' exonuclease